MKSVAGAIWILVYLSQFAFAQQAIELETLACSQWTSLNPEAKLYLGAWLDGYSASLLQKLQIDFYRSSDIISKLSEKCQGSPAAPVATAYREAMGVAQFGCDASASDTCWFSVYPTATAPATVNFALAGSQRTLIRQVKIGNDLYCVCINGLPPSIYSQCQPVPGRWCKPASVSSNYNN